MMLVGMASEISKNYSYKIQKHWSMLLEWLSKSPKSTDPGDHVVEMLQTWVPLLVSNGS